MTSCKEAGQKGADTVKQNADDFARDNLPLVRSLLDEGMTTGMLLVFLLRGHSIIQRGEWYASTVSNLLKRSGYAKR